MNINKQIKREDILNLKNLTDMEFFFKGIGFNDFFQANDTELQISISENSLEKLLIIIIEDNQNWQKYYNRLDTIEIKYLTIVGNNFNLFTFVRKEFTITGGIKYKKFSFSKENITNTTLMKLNKLEFNQIDSFDQIFDSTGVIKEFYEDFIKTKTILIQSIKGIDDGKTKIRYSQILMDRLIFLYFIQKKELLDKNPNYLQENLQIYKDSNKNFYIEFLIKLFFKILSKKNNVTKNFGEIPYLNGGLFRKHPIEEIYTDLIIPNNTFENIFSFFESYHWYVDERADYGEEKGISPEILGHIFEKTINSLSDTGNGQNETGAFYTPEVITQYLAKSSIIPQILDEFNLRKTSQYKDFKKFLNDLDSENDLIILFDILSNLKILDNACGSGAFLLAILNLLVEIWSKVLFKLLNFPSIHKITEPYLKRQKKSLEWFIYNFKSFVLFDQNLKWKYFMKRQIIILNLYGADIQEEATEIAKLRLWLSLVAEIDDSIENIEPLPNIDYNIRNGNSAIGFLTQKLDSLGLNQFIEITDLNKFIGLLEDIYPEEISTIKILAQKGGIIQFVRIKQILTELYKNLENEELQHLVKKIVDKILNIVQNQLDQQFITYTNSKISSKSNKISYKELKTIHPLHWILEYPHVLFSPKNPGFDIIIGNPPYGNLLSDLEKKILKTSNHEYIKEIASIFIERSLFLLKNEGRLCYVIPKSIGFYNAWEKIRIKLLNNRLENILDLGLGFEEVNSEQLTFIIKKIHKKDNKDLMDNLIQIYTADPIKKRTSQKKIVFNGIIQQNLLNSVNKILFRAIKPVEMEIIKEIQQNSNSFSKIYEGKVFRSYYISDNIKAEINSGNTIWIDKVPYIKKYYIENLKTIDIAHLIELSIPVKRRKDSKFVKNRQMNIKNKIKKIKKPRLFFKVLRGNRLVVYLDPKGQFLTTEKLVNAVILKDSKYDLFTLMAIINSPLPSFYIGKMVFSETTETSRVMDNPYMQYIPIPKNPPNSNILTILCQYLLFLNSTNELRSNYVDVIDFIKKKLVNPLVYDLYLFSTSPYIDTSILNDNIIPFDFYIWWDFYIKSLLNSLNIVEQENFNKINNLINKNIQKSIKKLRDNQILLTQITQIQEHTWTKTIHAMFPKLKEV